MAHSQDGFGLLPRDIATIPAWSESLDKPVNVMKCHTVAGHVSTHLIDDWCHSLCVVTRLVITHATGVST